MQRLKFCLIGLTVVSVIADTMLLPFYPEFFSKEFGVGDARHVGIYIAACCFTVMVTFPLWAKVATRIHELHLWVYTQFAAAIMGAACFVTESLVLFWVFSQLMLVFKASYLLIYPYVMRLEEKDKHLGVASLFAVLMHFGAIFGALLGGSLLEYVSPRAVFLVMPASDILQILVCIYLIRRMRVPLRITAESESKAGVPDEESNSAVTPVSKNISGVVFRFGVVSLLFYFSAFLIRPFFVEYWQSLHEVVNTLFAGLVYSIPAWVALAGIWLNRRFPRPNHYQVIAYAFGWIIVGASLQGVGEPFWIILGRCVYGWGLFQITVRLEVLLFDASEKKDFARNFSRVHLCQNLGVLISSFAVGEIVARVNLSTPFLLSVASFFITAVVFYRFFAVDIRRDQSVKVNQTEAGA
ncbi:hypothetical protein Mag101_00915 [Microbulbifer agarilyticus]|uniref:MFS transporter n=1 Tax=Microbulbifer agarilyticus TaxID=260552 RepID=A0A1Q2M1G3_9GAMM|nr:MFS transporter [Microbulbifer agarilyticus]AQQ66368.1 hypothetical protein Mag101_00915 [Microbulbifer agarilyticus]